jgi:hypothetical protein
MNKLTIDKEELFELLEQDGTIEIDSSPTKHDCSLTTSIVYKDGKTYQVEYESSYENGIEDDEFELVEVEPYKIEVTKWRIKK